MNCKEFAMMVSDLAGEKLIEATKYKLALAHKNTCAPCAARLANERSLTRALQVTASAETEQASAHTKAALLQAFAERARPLPAPRTLPNPATFEAPKAAAGEAKPASTNNVVQLFAERTPTRKISRWSWVAAAAVIIALLGLAALSFLKPHNSEAQQEAVGTEQKPVQPHPENRPQQEQVPAIDNQTQEPEKFVAHHVSPQSPHKTAPPTEPGGRVNPSRAIEHSAANEVTTDYIPLSYVANSTVMESGHVVRMMVARSTLISMGLPMNVERDKEMVKADVVVGDDGLARAIRFVYSGNQNKSR